MTQALIQLVAVGPQNVPINGKPEASVFRKAYQRVTHFALESVRQQFTGTVGFGNQVQCLISRNGDLLRQMELELTLPTLTAGAAAADFSWVPNLGEVLLRRVDLEVGGITIDTHYSRWFNIWQEVTRSTGKDSGYFKMIGNVSDLTNTVTATVGNETLSAPQKLYVPLKFWFCEHPELAFPLIACQRHDVKVYIQFESLENCVRSAGALPTAASALQADLYVTYVFLDGAERTNFATKAHEYLIEQVQFVGSESYNGQANITRRLDGFNHPVKEIAFVQQLDTAVSTAATRDLTDFTNGSDAPMVSSAKLVLNGNDRFSVRDGTYFEQVQPYYYHSRTPKTGINVYSFAEYPEEHQPTGTCNFSRIDNAQLVMQLSNTAASTSYVFMKSYNVGRFVSGLFGLAYAA